MANTIRSAQTVEGQANRAFRAKRRNADNIPTRDAIRESMEFSGVTITPHNSDIFDDGHPMSESRWLKDLGQEA